MGKKGNWFSSLKRTLSPSSKQKKSQKSENTGFEEERPLPVVPEIVEHVGGSTDSHPFPPPEEVNSVDVEVEPLQAASSAAVASTSTMTRYLGKSKEVAAIKIQTVFRGYLIVASELLETVVSVAVDERPGEGGGELSRKRSGSRVMGLDLAAAQKPPAAAESGEPYVRRLLIRL